MGQRTGDGRLRKTYDEYRRLYAKGRERTLVVFQKPYAWEVCGGGLTVPGTLETILDLLPSPVQIELHRIILVVVDYETWKQMARQKQAGEGMLYVRTKDKNNRI